MGYYSPVPPLKEMLTVVHLRVIPPVVRIHLYTWGGRHIRKVDRRFYEKIQGERVGCTPPFLSQAKARSYSSIDPFSLQYTFWFPISDLTRLSWEYSYCFFVSYSCTCIRQCLKESRVASHGFQWENNTYQLKRYINFTDMTFTC